MGNPLPLNLAQECSKAEKILRDFVDPAHGGLDRIIPMSVLRRAQGLAIFSVVRLGFLMSARAGSGVVIARLQDDSWSAPSALGLGGVGAGFNAGLDVTDFVIVLNSKTAVRTFMATGSLQLGGNLSVAVGPLGRAAEASGAVNSSGNMAAIFSYSKSKGLYGGVSIEGTVLVDRSDANSKTYHRNVTAKQILAGSVEIPSFADPLISLIEKYTLSGSVRSGLDGRSASARGYGYYGPDDNDDPVDSINRDLRQSRISTSSSPPLSTGPASRSAYGDGGGLFDDEPDGDAQYARARRSPEYAFGSGRGHSTNSPKKTRTSFFGGSTSSIGGAATNYGASTPDRDNANVFDPDAAGYGRNRSSSQSTFNREQGSFSRAGVQPRKDVQQQKYEYGGAQERSTYRAVGKGSFPTKFTTDTWGDEDGENGQFSSTARGQDARDPFSIGDDNNEDAYYNKFTYAASSPYSGRHVESDRPVNDRNNSLATNGEDLMRFDDDDEHNREYSRASTSRRTAPPPPSSIMSNGATGRRKVSGMDSLDKELQQRSSMSSNDSDPEYRAIVGDQDRRGTPTAKSGWRSDFGLPNDDYAAPLPQQKRPPMHHRTSSAQKLWNRVRGNSQSASRSAFADSWEARYGSGSGYGQGGTPSPSSTPRPTSGASRREPSPQTQFHAARDMQQQPMHRQTPSPNRFGNGSAASPTTRTPPPSSALSIGDAIGRTGSATPLSSSLQAAANAIPTMAEMQVLAKFDFVGQEEHDLSFKRGDVIDILRRTESREDWWLGRVDGRIGNLPANFTEDL